MPKLSSLKPVGAFMITVLLCGLLIGVSMIRRMDVERLTMEKLLTDKSLKTTETITRQLYKTETLAALVLQNDGEIVNFEKVASTLADDPSILSIAIAPRGVVTHIYPMTEGNERLIGFDYFSDSAGNLEAQLARYTGQLVMAGPFDLLQGVQAIVGRLPVFTTNPDGSKEFWGLVAIALKFPQILETISFDEIDTLGYAYEVWRINPDTGEKQVFLDGGYGSHTNKRYIEKRISFYNAEWYFCILPVREWYEYPEMWLLTALGLSVSFLVAFLVSNNETLKTIKSKFEVMSKIDYLTNVYNRRSFMEMAFMQVERSVRLDSQSFIIILDIDHFKDVNDANGHAGGDKVLRELPSRLRSVIRPYDILARYGGEEFILLISDIQSVTARKVAERMRKTVYGEPFEINGKNLTISASFGVAEVLSTSDLEEAINCADKALYKAKAGGRNKVVYMSRSKESRSETQET